MVGDVARVEEKVLEVITLELSYGIFTIINHVEKLMGKGNRKSMFKATM